MYLRAGKFPENTGETSIVARPGCKPSDHDYGSILHTLSIHAALCVADGGSHLFVGTGKPEALFLPGAVSGKARSYTVENELDGEGREQHAQNAGENVGAGFAEEAHDPGCEQQRYEHEHQN